MLSCYRWDYHLLGQSAPTTAKELKSMFTLSEQVLLPSRRARVSPSSSVWFMLFNLLFSVWCVVAIVFVCVCVCVFFFVLYLLTMYFLRENPKDNQEWTIQRYWQHWVHKMKTNQTIPICIWSPLCANKPK